MRWERWRRTAEGPGWPSIFVYVDEAGNPAPQVTGGVQCATLDRIPFTMKKRALLDRYEREGG